MTATEDERAARPATVAFRATVLAGPFHLTGRGPVVSVRVTEGEVTTRPDSPIFLRGGGHVLCVGRVRSCFGAQADPQVVDHLLADPETLPDVGDELVGERPSPR